MAGRRTFHTIHTLNALDYEVETKVPGLGRPFTPSEMILVLLVPMVLTVPMVVCLYPLIKGWGVLSFLLWVKLVPMAVTRLKKNKPRSWLWDYCHRWGLGLDSRRHFRRPFSTRAWVGARTVVRSAWTEPTKGGLVPTKPMHLTYGLPAIRVMDHVTRGYRSSITPQPSLGGYVLRNRRYEPLCQRIPDGWRNAVYGADADGHAAIQDYRIVRTVWRQPHVN